MVRDSADNTTVSRRKLLATSGVAGTLALAGCMGGSGSEGTTEGGDQSAKQDSGTKQEQSNSISGSVNIAGSSTVFPISQALAEEFQKEHNKASVSVSSTGTGGGFANYFCVGKTDINDASRPIKQSEKEKCKNNGVTPVEFQVATDALTVVVNQEADWVDCLSFKELQKIWGPDNSAQKWSDVRSEWPDKELNLYGAASTSGTFDFFTETVMGEEGKHRSDYQGTEKDNTIVQAVQGDQYAMGYFGFAYYIENKDSLKGVAVKNENTSCTKPTFKTAKAGKYPLSRPLYIYVAKESLKDKTVQEFVRYYIEKSKTDLVKQVGYVPVTDKKAQANLDKLDKVINEVA
ncbi:PstS family phosphate ABC transporter substrate-binding protein [Halorussus sp. AFM4]|uniref:PstS family phosphate ABC transporter substrate-binding protein n=1 Tax=Halorussus sp. AFM4 TaxID=3421651 RepID=UPI003EB999D0